MQLAFLEAASIVVQHAAMKAVRTASVVIHDNPAFYGGEAQGLASGERLEAIKATAKLQIATLGSTDTMDVTTDQDSYTPNQMIRLRITYPYKCNVPLANRIV